MASLLPFSSLYRVWAIDAIDLLLLLGPIAWPVLQYFLKWIADNSISIYHIHVKTRTNYMLLIGGVLLLFLSACSDDIVLNPGTEGGGGSGSGGDGTTPAYSYIVTFDSGEADTPADPSVIQVQDPDVDVGSLPIAPVRSGYVFGGWFIGNEWTGSAFSAATVVNNHIIVRARWYLQVEFDSDGGTAISSELVRPGFVISAPDPAPVKDGWVFNGWYNGASAWNFADPVTTAMTLVAQWQEPSYSVTLDPGDGTVDPSTWPVTYGEVYGSLPAPSRNGYNFLGWYTEAGGNGDLITAGVTVTNLTAHTLYAHWEQAVADLSVTIDVSNPAEIDVSMTGEAILSKSATNYPDQMNVTVNSGKTSYSWQLDEVVAASHADITVSPGAVGNHVAEVTAAGLGFGVHSVNVIVEITPGDYRSAQFDFSVVE